MRIIRHIVVDFTPRNVAAFAEVGVTLSESGVLDIAENGPLWRGVRSLRRRWEMRDPLTWPEFDEPERLAAPWLGLRGIWTNGYPQPESDWKVRTFDAVGGCQACGITGPQTSPYRMAKPPKWGRRWLAGLFWASDALFVRRDVYDAVFAPRGVPGRAVLLRQNGGIIPDAVQLAPTETVPLDVSGLKSSRCGVCGRRKYVGPSRGFLPLPLGPVKGHAFLSEQWFGGGAAAFKTVLLSPEIYRELKDLEGRQVVWHPCASPASVNERTVAERFLTNLRGRVLRRP